jgi:hypothetical protein
MSSSNIVNYDVDLTIEALFTVFYFYPSSVSFADFCNVFSTCKTAQKKISGQKKLVENTLQQYRVALKDANLLKDERLMRVQLISVDTFFALARSKVEFKVEPIDIPKIELDQDFMNSRRIELTNSIVSFYVLNRVIFF